MLWWLKTNYDTSEFGFPLSLTRRVCTTEYTGNTYKASTAKNHWKLNIQNFICKSEILFWTCLFQNQLLHFQNYKNKTKEKFLSFLASMANEYWKFPDIWLSQYKFLVKNVSTAFFHIPDYPPFFFSKFTNDQFLKGTNDKAILSRKWMKITKCSLHAYQTVHNIIGIGDLLTDQLPW